MDQFRGDGLHHFHATGSHWLFDGGGLDRSLHPGIVPLWSNPDLSDEPLFQAAPGGPPGSDPGGVALGEAPAPGGKLWKDGATPPWLEPGGPLAGRAVSTPP